MRIAANSAASLIGVVVPALVTLWAYPTLVNRLGPAEFGIWVAAGSLSLSMNVFDFGIAAATTKLISEDGGVDRDRTLQIILTSLCFYGAIGLLFSALLWVLAPTCVPWFRIPLESRRTGVAVFRVAGMQLTAQFITSVLISTFKGFGKFQNATVVNCAGTVLMYGVGAGAALRSNISVLNLAWIVFTGQVVTAVFAAVLVHREVLPVCSLRRCMPSCSMLRRMFSFGSGMGVHAASAVFFNQIQRVFVGVLLGPTAITAFSLGVTITSKTHALVSAGTEVLFPFASNTDNVYALRSIYRRMVLLSGAFAVLSLGCLYLFGPLICRVWLGPRTASLVLPTILPFCVAYAFLAVGTAPFHLLNGLGKPWMNVRFDAVNVCLLGVFLGIGISWGMTLPKFAWAIAATYALGTILVLAVVQLSIWPTLIPRPVVVGNRREPAMSIGEGNSR